MSSLELGKAAKYKLLATNVEDFSNKSGKAPCKFHTEACPKTTGSPKPIIMVGILETTHIQTRAIGGVKRGNSA